MYRTGAALFQRREMRLRPVTFVAGKTVAGILAVKLHHETVARDFRQNARGGDGKAQGVAGHDGRLRELKRLDAQAVHQDMLGRRIQFGQRQIHGAMGRLENLIRSMSGASTRAMPKRISGRQINPA